ncbi:helix-turn-helix domain-containing protein [Morganella morganii]|uniref:helix-turn-helix domain-containing protein n=1 Tax=Morganella morganii TaxID=582 RepID=UPI002113ABCF|nr:helix-turn-helix domain-containing protein [Morganella morganii]
MLSRLLLTDADVSKEFAVWLRKKRESRKWSRDALAARSLVPASTIKKIRADRAHIIPSAFNIMAMPG